MITILKYVFLGLLLYICIIPILEQLASLLCQWLENIKGKLIYQQSLLQKKIDDTKEDEQISNSSISAIGFSIPIEEEYEEEDDD